MKLGNASRVKRVLSPVQAPDESSREIQEENTTQCMGNVSPLSGMLQEGKRRRSALGLPSRIKTPLKQADSSDKENSYSENRTKLSNRQSEDHTQHIFESISNNATDRRYSICSIDTSSGRGSGAAQDPNHVWTIKDFHLSKPLGRGKFGNVYMGREKASRHVVAVKVLFKGPMKAAQRVHIVRREIEIQSRLRHPNILSLFGYFHDDKNVYMILDFLSNGELFKHISRQGGAVDEATCKRYLTDVISAVSYLHDRGVAHRDLKPENCLISSNGSLQIADFGCAVHVGILGSTRRHTICGTPEYIAPEMLRGDHSLEVDIWALGIFAHELLYGRTPFAEKAVRKTILAAEDDNNDTTHTCQATYDRILQYNGDLSFPTSDRFEVSGDMKKLILDLLAPSPSDRPTATQTLKIVR